MRLNWLFYCIYRKLERDAKIVPIAHNDDKRKFTALLTASGEYLSLQLLYQQKCYPQVSFLENWDGWYSQNHWSNEATIKPYLNNNYR